MSTTLLPRTRWRRGTAIVASALALSLVAAACGGDDNGDAADPEPEETTGDEEPAGEDEPPADDVTLTMWTRAGTAAVSQAYAEAYEAATGNVVEVTDFPNEEYPARLASAAGAGELPDIFGTDVVFSAQFANEGLYMDITDQLAAFEFADQVAPAHVAAGTLDGRNFVVPHTIDM